MMIIDNYNVEDDGNSLTITATVKVYFEYCPSEWVSFDLSFDIDDLNDIEDGEVYDLGNFGYISYTYKASSLNPEDEDDVFTILEIAADSCSLGYDLDCELTYYSKDLYLYLIQ